MRWSKHLKTYSTEERLYFLEITPKKLVNQSQSERYCKLMTDFDIIKSKITEFGPQNLIEDYQYALSNDEFVSKIQEKFGDELRMSLSKMAKAYTPKVAEEKWYPERSW